MPEIPNPKELVKGIASTVDSIMETATAPVKDVVDNVASTIGLPKPPEPPKISDIVDALPELPMPGASMSLPLPELPMLPKPVHPKPATTQASVAWQRLPKEVTPPSKIVSKIKVS